MVSMILGVFRDRDDAENAILSLEDKGYNPKDFSIVMKDKTIQDEVVDTTGVKVVDGATTGATTETVGREEEYSRPAYFSDISKRRARDRR